MEATDGRLLKSKRSPQKMLSVFSLQEVRAYRLSSRHSSQKYLRVRTSCCSSRYAAAAGAPGGTGVLPFLGGQVFSLDHPHGQDILQTPAVVLVGVDGSPQVLHPFVSFCCRAAREALCARGGGHLGDAGGVS